MLSGGKIKKLLKTGKISISPDPIIKEASVKIHFSGEFGITRDKISNKGKIIVKPKEFILGLTKEKICLPNDHAGLYDGHISLSSKGLQSHMGSMFIDPGFEGQILLEIFNASDSSITLEEGLRSGHLIIFKIQN